MVDLLEDVFEYIAQMEDEKDEEENKEESNESQKNFRVLNKKVGKLNS